MKKQLLIFALLTAVVVTLMVSTVHANTTPPQSFLQDLKAVIQDTDDQLFRGYAITNTKQLKDALTHKIDAVIQLIEEGKHQAAYNKLHNDITRARTQTNITIVHARRIASGLPTHIYQNTYTHTLGISVSTLSGIMRAA